MPQKNSGNKKSKRGEGVAGKNTRFIQDILDDARREGAVDEIHIARVIRKMGNGRVEVFYVDDKKIGVVAQAVIRGSFRGKAKRAVWIEGGSIVALADIGIGGSAALEIMAVLDSDSIRDIRDAMDIDPRIFAVDKVDTSLLVGDVIEEGFVFEDEINIDKI